MRTQRADRFQISLKTRTAAGIVPGQDEDIRGRGHGSIIAAGRAIMHSG